MSEQIAYGILYTMLAIVTVFVVYIAVWQPKKWK